MPLIGSKSAGSKGYGMLVNASGIDSSFNSVSLLLHGDGVNTAQNNTFIDSSVNALTVLTVGNPAQGTTSPFPLNGFAYNPNSNAGSGYFDGTSTTYISIADSAAVQLGSGNFTIEFWCNLSNVSAGFLAGKGNETTVAGSQFSFYMPGTWDFYSGTTVYALTKPPLTANTWQHVAIIRNGTTITGYLNGASYASNSVAVGTATLNTGGATALKIGAYSTAGVSGYISGFRITKNATVYSPPFTVPTSPLTAITDTSLLLNFTNAGVIDNASKNNLQTLGSAQITTATKRFGIGSMLFNGTTDYLTIPNSSNFAFGTGDFTVEAWVYPTANSNNYPTILEAGNHQNATGVVFLHQDGATGTKNVPCIYSGTPTPGFIKPANTGTLTLNSWNYLVYQRSSGNLQIFVNGVGSNTASFTQNITDPSTLKTSVGFASLGAVGNTGSYYFSGNIDDLRVTKGVARYTTNFTPSNAPFSNI